MEVPSYAIPFTIVGLAGYLANGGCSCGCGYGEEGCIYAPLTTGIGNTSNTEWQSALVLFDGDLGYSTANSCGDDDAYSRLGLSEDARCTMFAPRGGSLSDSCEALSASNAPCTQSGLKFSGDNTGFGSDYCAHGDDGTGPESYCTYQPATVRTLFIILQCLFPGLVALLAAWPVKNYPMLRLHHHQLNEVYCPPSRVQQCGWRVDFTGRGCTAVPVAWAVWVVCSSYREGVGHRRPQTGRGCDGSADRRVCAEPKLLGGEGRVYARSDGSLRPLVSSHQPVPPTVAQCRHLTPHEHAVPASLGVRGTSDTALGMLQW
jgi:hypothetical protein